LEQYLDNYCKLSDATLQAQEKQSASEIALSECHAAQSECLGVHEEWRKEWRAACRAEGDLNNDFAEARRLFSKRQELVAKVATARKASDKADLELSQAELSVNDGNQQHDKRHNAFVRSVLLSKSRSTSLWRAIHDAENDYVQSIKAAHQGNTGVATTVDDYDYALAELQKAQAAALVADDALNAANDELKPKLEQQSKRLFELMPKPVDESTQAEYQSLRDDSKAFLELEAKCSTTTERCSVQFRELAVAEEVYQNALLAVFRSTR